MSHYTINTTPESNSFNLLHCDGRPFNELGYMRDTLRANRNSVGFLLRQIKQYRHCIDYYESRLIELRQAHLEALMQAGELVLINQRIIAKGKQLAKEGRV